MPGILLEFPHFISFTAAQHFSPKFQRDLTPDYKLMGQLFR
jgi:hypothetical protein